MALGRHIAPFDAQAIGMETLGRFHTIVARWFLFEGRLQTGHEIVNIEI